MLDSECLHEPCVGLQILCMHGGLSPELKNLEQIKRIPRPTDVPDTGLLCDLLWADPDKEIQGWGDNDRGVSYTFGPNSVSEFLTKHDLDLVCRAHQVQPRALAWPCTLSRAGSMLGSHARQPARRLLHVFLGCNKARRFATKQRPR